MLSLRQGSRLGFHWMIRDIKSRQFQETFARTSSRGLLCQACQPCQLYSSDNSRKLYAEQLKTRGVIQVTGKDASVFLQGLITNDMNCLDCHGCKSVYSMVLNAQGRVLYDIIIYNASSAEKVLDNFLIECDAEVSQELVKHMKKYKLRRKVTVADLSESHKLWSFYRPAEHASTPEPSLKLEFKDSRSVVTCTSDPRLKSFGWRCIATYPVEGLDVETPCSDSSYDIERMKLGIGEGVVDLPPGKALPLESNLVYLHGVSFNKGCYVGQELTARTHHTGVTRKRLVPLTLESEQPGVISPGSNIEKPNGRSAGVLRNLLSKYGLGVVRLSEMKNDLSVSAASGVKVKVMPHQPAWWPKEEDSESSMG
ncbi:putative transferase CAF17 homolog, mitochondrial [Lineus longissimus]|uniref:putative transferase CAF17 homolog, mitochondrial n=1 Tax=Lineus longissimus TaxID=88925 RepID=UPI00315C951A